MVPLLVGATSQWIAESVVDLRYRWRLEAWSRRLPAMLGFLLTVLVLDAAQPPAIQEAGAFL